MAEFLLELASEEIPARMQARAAEELRRRAAAHLDKAGLAHAEIATYVTPRRLALVVEGLPHSQPDTSEEKRGPKVGAPEKAVQGFLRGAGLTSIEEAEVRETEKGRFYYAVRHIPGRATPEVLAEIVPELVRELPWPKSMRWGTHGLRYVRPLHSILALFDGRPVPGELDLDGDTLAFGRVTRGHPFLAPDAFTVESAADYRAQLHAASVMVDPDERRESIRRQAAEAAGREGLTPKADEGLLAENAGLTEWPVVHMGTIDEQFMTLPPEVLTVSMRTHQKYFAVEHPDGQLANRFLVVANIETADDGAAVVAGNERVLRARLADAAFFWDQDRKTPLRDRVGDLAGVVFHARLGTLYDKVGRMDALAVHLAETVGADRDKASSGARLAKADLTTAMVDEFPELQGLMGSYYAEADNEHAEVVRAVADHYAPQGPGEACPSAPEAVAVALADKLDTLAGFFAIDEKPTGSKDPFALRRAALGVIRLIVENELRLPLAAPIREALRLQNAEARQALAERAPHAAGETAAGETQLVGELLSFLTDRLKVVLRGKGVRHDLIAACFAVEKPDGGAEDDLVRLLARVDALERFLKSDDGANLLTAYRRAARIVEKEEKKDKARFDAPVDRDRLTAEAEHALHEALTAAAGEAHAALAREDFTAAMRALAALRRPVDAFFDGVTVNADDPALRANRLRLLKQIGATLARVADFSNIEG
ncbi:glycyl-tRNA synthetase beta chain [Limimonas halophila]|uniref:Glycine--tRNA ligase beta subunit n=1 Tax=Limimonas halophila TaxID=1082479 RepID=A0A1G7KXP6_9PROT|nr:glycine--tRNA ligase subunit beta [Limimonas halophila]SDF41529.1 glycyl-tRNA synthetase beta chain [Limimonas halophila]